MTDAALSNEALLAAVRALSVVTEKGSGFKRVVNHRDLGAEELGSIYEALLEYVPTWDPATRQYRLGDAAGNVRKTTGSYYTPTSLIECLLDTALNPVLDDAEKTATDAADAERRLLGITVCDPACGSGHFLVAAARRIAKRVAKTRTGDPEPPPEQVRAALRDVVGCCIYGVDLNPLAAELAKVSLWLEAMQPGKPLTFLDAQIKVGNALVGATPALLDAGIPQEAFKPIGGDDRKLSSALAKRNKIEAGGQGVLFGPEEVRTSNSALAEKAAGLSGAGLSLADVHIQQQRLKAYLASPEYTAARLAADAWCAAFVWPKTADAAPPITNAVLDRLRAAAGDDGDDDGARLDTTQHAEIERLAAEYHFFHWHLEFPHIFPTDCPADGAEARNTTGWCGGFSAVVGNPPWEQAEVDERSFFSAVVPGIATVKLAAKRKRMIEELRDTLPELVREFEIEKMRMARFTHYVQNSGRLSLAAMGRINLYRLFGQVFDEIVAPIGRSGVILPTGIVTDLNSSRLCRAWVERGALVEVVDFINRRGVFPDVKPPVRFCLLTLAGPAASVRSIRTFVMAEAVADLGVGSRWVTLDVGLILQMNPETATLPLFRDSAEAIVSQRIYEKLRLFGELGIATKQGFVNMTTDSRLFRTRDDLEEAGAELDMLSRFRLGKESWWPVVEAKLIDAFDPRARTFDGVAPASRYNTKATPRKSADPDPAGRFTIARYWVPADWAAGEWPSSRDWVLAGKEVTDNKTSSRTSVFAPLPRAAASYTCQLVYADGLSVAYLGCLLVQFNSFAFDFLVRQKISGSHLTASILRQLPVLSPNQCAEKAPWSEGSVQEWLTVRAGTLSWTAQAIEGFVKTCGAAALRPTQLSSECREILRCELDAACLILFGLERSETEYALDSFAILARMEVAAHGEYRTKRLILQIYDQMVEAQRTGEPYRSPIDGLDALLP